jgi:hypothetical protein
MDETLSEIGELHKRVAQQKKRNQGFFIFGVCVSILAHPVGCVNRVWSLSVDAEHRVLRAYRSDPRVMFGDPSRQVGEPVKVRDIRCGTDTLGFGPMCEVDVVRNGVESSELWLINKSRLRWRSPYRSNDGDSGWINIFDRPMER